MGFSCGRWEHGGTRSDFSLDRVPLAAGRQEGEAVATTQERRSRAAQTRVVTVGIGREANSECILEVEMAGFLYRPDVRVRGGEAARRGLERLHWVTGFSNSAEFPHTFIFLFSRERVRREIKMFIAALIKRVKLDTNYRP